jgi:hypothetical protein
MSETLKDTSLDAVNVQVTFIDGTTITMTADDEYFHISPDTEYGSDDLKIDNKRLRLVQDLYDTLLEAVQSI